jgi:uroporphyrinogen-III synthase
MPSRFKSDIPKNKPMYEKDESSGKFIEEILSKYPKHKRVLFLRSKFDNNEILSSIEIAELKKFKELLFKQTYK